MIENDSCFQFTFTVETRLHAKRFIYLYAPTGNPMSAHEGQGNRGGTRGRGGAPAAGQGPRRDPWEYFENWRMRMWAKMLWYDGLRAHNNMVRARRARA